MIKVKKPTPILKRTLPQVIGLMLAVLGIIGFLASSVLSIEKVQLLKDPSYQPSCNLSPLLSCGSVMSTEQAEAFGFPNPFIGVAGFAVVATIGVALLADAQFKRWFWLGLQAGTLFGIGFITWLQYQSIYNIGALCPYCIIVWAVMTPIFLYVFIYNVRQRHLRVSGKTKIATDFIQRHHGDILLIWITLIITAILTRFWYYWSTFIPGQ